MNKKGFVLFTVLITTLCFSWLVYLFIQTTIFADLVIYATVQDKKNQHLESVLHLGKATIAHKRQEIESLLLTQSTIHAHINLHPEKNNLTCELVITRSNEGFLIEGFVLNKARVQEGRSSFVIRDAV